MPPDKVLCGGDVHVHRPATFLLLYNPRAVDTLFIRKCQLTAKMHEENVGLSSASEPALSKAVSAALNAIPYIMEVTRKWLYGLYGSIPAVNFPPFTITPFRRL